MIHKYKKFLIILASITSVLLLSFVIIRSMDQNFLLTLDERICHMEFCVSNIGSMVEVTGAVPSSIVSPSGNELISWRYQLSPYFQADRPALNESLAWNHPINTYELDLFIHNMSLVQILHQDRIKIPFEKQLGYMECRPLSYYCYQYKPSYYRDWQRETSNILAVVGDDTAFDPIHRQEWNQMPQDLLVLMEVRNSRIHWAAPYDVRVEDLQSGRTSNLYELGLDTDGFLVAFRDRAVYYLKHDTPWELLAKLATVQGAKTYDRDQLLGKYMISKNLTVCE